MTAPVNAIAGDGDRSELDKYPPDQYELHGVVNWKDCGNMQRRFEQQGRKVKLKKAIVNPNKGMLQWICIFEGDDIDNSIFQDTRYNSAKEYDTP